MFKWYLRFTGVNPVHVYTDGAGDGSGGGSPAPTPAPSAPAAAPASPAPGSGTPTPSLAPGPGSPAPGNAPVNGGAPQPSSQFTYEQDRSDWIPRDRFNEAVQRERAEAERIRQIALGVTPREPVDPRRTEAREAILELLPELRPLFEQAPNLMSAHQRAEQRMVSQTLNSIYTEAATILGTERLNTFQEQTLAQAFLGYLQGTPELARRFDNGDPRVVGEFLSEYRKHFLDPARRSGQAPNVPAGGGNRPVPGGNRGTLPNAPRPSGMVPAGGGNGGAPRTEQEVLSGAFAHLRETMANRNG